MCILYSCDSCRPDGKDLWLWVLQVPSTHNPALSSRDFPLDGTRGGYTFIYHIPSSCCILLSIKGTGKKYTLETVTILCQKFTLSLHHRWFSSFPWARLATSTRTVLFSGSCWRVRSHSGDWKDYKWHGWSSQRKWYMIVEYTVEPPSKGHFGTSNSCPRLSLIERFPLLRGRKYIKSIVWGKKSRP